MSKNYKISNNNKSNKLLTNLLNLKINFNI